MVGVLAEQTVENSQRLLGAPADLEHARDFVRSELGRLIADDDQTRRLSATLLVYLEENASPRRTAHPPRHGSLSYLYRHRRAR